MFAVSLLLISSLSAQKAMGSASDNYQLSLPPSVLSILQLTQPDASGHIQANKPAISEKKVLYVLDSLRTEYLRVVYTYDANGNGLTSQFFPLPGNTSDVPERITCTYNNHGIESKSTEFFSSGQWTEWLNQRYYYNDAGLLTSIITYSKESGTTYRTSIEYNNQQQVTTRLVESSSNNVSWLFVTKDTYTYTPSGKIHSYLFDVNTNLSHRYTYTYDTNDSLIAKVFEQRSSATWEFVTQEVYQYFSSNNTSTFTRQFYNNGSWLDEEHHVYTYNNSQKVILDEMGTLVQGTFNPTFRRTYTYNTAGEVNQEFSESNSNNVWANYQRVSYQYSADNKKTEEFSESWVESAWVPNYRTTYGYDTYKNLNYYHYETATINGWIDRQITELFDFAGSQYEIHGSKFFLNYSQITTAVNGDNSNTPAVFSLDQNYPNPFNPSTTINFTIPQTSVVTLTIYNALGQQVAELINTEMTAGTHSVNWHAGNVSSGIYFYSLKAGAFSATKKLVLIK